MQMKMLEEVGSPVNILIIDKVSMRELLMGYVLVYRLTKICPGVPVNETCVTLVNRIIA